MSEKPVTGYAPMQNLGQMPPAYPPPQAGYPSHPISSQPGFQTSQTTTVVVSQPAPPLILQQGQRDWNSGLFACFDDCYSCLMGFFCSPILLCQVSSRMGEGCMFATCCQGALIGLRIKLRTQQNIQGTLCNDYCLGSCCGPCVLCQLSRELDRCQVN
ncbi:Placenta-specific gene 8 protein [Acropora cervicornis]|uniref:Placenta-specific gene 8 protein n=1 Tax=Acropora cervicornis TaxID=6130 RepID=A0AAD9QA72_ACRCE|nr:Placenta-specific gene 8 protein [Acropora cervicornis]